MIDEKYLKNAQIIDPFDDLTDEEKNEARLCAEKEMRETANFFETLKAAKEAYDKWCELEKTLNKISFLGDLSWMFDELHYNCEVRDGCLYDNYGNLLSADGSHIDEEILCFANKHIGYLGDVDGGMLFVKLGDTNDFMGISYSC